MAVKLKDKIFSIKKERYHKVVRLLGFKAAFQIKGEKERYLRFLKEIGPVDYEIVHLLPATSFAVELVNFLNSFVDHSKHLFIFKSGPTLYWAAAEADNVIEGNLFTLKIDLRKTKKIIAHSLLLKSDIRYFYNNPQLLDRTYWVVYGGDLYDFKNTHESNFVKYNLKGVLTTFDKPEYNKQYGEKLCMEIIFPDKSLKNIELKPRKTKGETINILVNHCSDKSSFDILSNLEKYKNENIKIYSGLAYTSVYQSLHMKKDIIKYGKKLFGDKFVPVTQWMDKDEYMEFLKRFDVLILGMDRQQGIGNLRGSLLSGAKAFLNVNNPIYESLENIGLTIFDCNSIKDLTFEEFINLKERDRTKNREIFVKRSDENYIKDLWSKVFDYE